MNIITRLLSNIRSKDIKPKNTRSIQTVFNTTLFSDWVLSKNTPIDEELKAANPDVLRGKGRDLALSNEYIIKFINLMMVNIVGENGVVLQNRAKFSSGQLDKYANQKIYEHWWEWGKRGNCDITGRYSWIDIQHMIIKSVVRDGEVLIRFIRSGEYGVQLQVMEADILRTDYNVIKLPNGNKVVMGVEQTQAGKPVAYHIKDRYRYDNIYGNGERVSADDMLHIYLPERLHQSRGIPWMLSAVTNIRHLQKYIEAEVVAARASACQMGFIKTTNGEYSGENGFSEIEMSPATIQKLNNGEEYIAHTPTHPNTSFKEFVKGVLRTIAGGLKGVGYNSLASDLEGVTYSSLRQGAIDERDNYKVLQQWFIDSCVNPIFEHWLRCLLTLSQYSYDFKYRNDFKYYNQPYWYPKRWQWVDPEKETNAALLAINNNLKTYGMLAAEMGYDFYEIVEQRAQEEELLKKFGLKKNLITENPKKPDNTTDKEEEDELDEMNNSNKDKEQ